MIMIARIVSYGTVVCLSQWLLYSIVYSARRVTVDNVRCWCESVKNKRSITQYLSTWSATAWLLPSSYHWSCFVESASPIWNKRLANTKRPCDCRVLRLRLISSLCSCAHSISDMTSFSCRDQGRDSVFPVLWMSTWRNSKSAGKRRA